MPLGCKRERRLHAGERYNARPRRAAQDRRPASDRSARSMTENHHRVAGAGSEFLKRAGHGVVQGLEAGGVGFADTFVDGVDVAGSFQLPPICCRITNSSYCSQISAIFPSLIRKSNISAARTVRGGSLGAGGVVKGKRTLL